MAEDTRSYLHIANQEERLHDAVIRAGKNPIGKFALIVHLSRLEQHHRQAHHVRIAEDCLNGLSSRYEGQSYRRANEDLVLLVRDVPPSAVEAVIDKLHHLFAHDPLSRDTVDIGWDSLCTWFELEREYRDFRAVIEHHYQAFYKSPAAQSLTQVPEPAQVEERVEIDLPRLHQLEGMIQVMDADGVMKRQTVYALLDDNHPTPVFSEVYVSMAELSERMVPGVDIVSNRWLFQHMTESLDRRLLAALPESEAGQHRTVSVNLNVSTLLTDAFLAFDRSFRERQRKAIVIELQLLDIFSDVTSYRFARDFAQERGYRICIDGLTVQSLPLIDRKAIGADMEKIQWTPAAVVDTDEKHLALLRSLLKKGGGTRTVLCHCDDRTAVAFGKSLGIALFQGRYLDQIAASKAAAAA